MSKLHQLHDEKIVPTLHAETVLKTVVLLPLIAGVIAGIISIVGALNRLPSGQDYAAPPVSDDHQPLRGHGF